MTVKHKEQIVIAYFSPVWILRCLSRRLGRSKCFPHVGHGSARLLLLHSLLGLVGGGEKLGGGGEGLMEGKLRGESAHLVGLKWLVGEGRGGSEKEGGIAGRLGREGKWEACDGEEQEGEDERGGDKEDEEEVGGWERSRGASRRLVSAS